MTRHGVVPQASERAQRAPGASSDAELMRRLTASDLGALGELYDRYQAAVRRFVGRATADAHDVDDLVQATFLTAAHCASRYDGRASCRPWLLGIAVRLLRRRRHALARLFGLLTSLGTLRPQATDPRAKLSARTDLERALGALSEAKRVTLLLAEVEELSCQEIAEALGVPVGTVWTRLHAARRELRRALEAEES
jgi:RNA polymerase sigma-70 factor, ECF subfamily